MYWQKKWNEEDKDQALKDEILAIRRDHKDYGYRRIHLELKNRGWAVNKKKVQRLVQIMKLQVRFCKSDPMERNTRSTTPTKVSSERLRRIVSIDASTPASPTKKSPPTPRNSNTTLKMRRGNFKQRNSTSIRTWTCTIWKSSATSSPTNPTASPCYEA